MNAAMDTPLNPDPLHPNPNPDPFPQPEPNPTPPEPFPPPVPPQPTRPPIPQLRHKKERTQRGDGEFWSLSRLYGDACIF